jgi:methylated-DNA-[protein]-cysteine S-methyltransferase
MAKLSDPSPLGIAAYRDALSRTGKLMIHSIVDSPLGSLLLTADAGNLTGLYPPEHVRLPTDIGERDDSAFELTRSQLQEYFSGDRTCFELPLAPRGTTFQRQVWDELCLIGYGRTTSYRSIADQVGNLKAVRAVGLANGRNPISIIVPCHRVVGSDGKLTGYAGGLAAKQWLLGHEARHAASLSC